MRRIIKVLFLVFIALALVLISFYLGLCTRARVKHFSPFVRREKLDLLRSEAPALFGHDFMNSMQVAVAGKYMIWFCPEGTNASLLVVDGRSERFALAVLDTHAKGIPNEFWIADVKTRRGFIFTDRDGDGSFDWYSAGTTNDTMIDMNLDGNFDIRVTPDGKKSLAFDHEWCPYRMSNHAAYISTEGLPFGVDFEDGKWIRLEAETTGSDKSVESIGSSTPRTQP